MEEHRDRTVTICAQARGRDRAGRENPDLGKVSAKGTQRDKHIFADGGNLDDPQVVLRICTGAGFVDSSVT